MTAVAASLCRLPALSTVAAAVSAASLLTEAASPRPGHSRMRSLTSVWYHMKVALK